MIIYPNLENYKSDYTAFSNNYVVSFTDADRLHYIHEFRVCAPMHNCQELYDYCDKRIPFKFRNKILLGVEEFDSNNEKHKKLEKVSIWKLDWFCRNITEKKPLKIIFEINSNCTSSFTINAASDSDIETVVNAIKNYAKK